MILLDLQEEADVIGTEFAVSEGCYLSSVPKRDILNKENSLDPGPWTGKPRKVRTAAVPVSLPQQPSFECENTFIFLLTLLQELEY
jgi:hypothetical protein